MLGVGIPRRSVEHVRPGEQRGSTLVLERDSLGEVRLAIGDDLRE